MENFRDGSGTADAAGIFPVAYGIDVMVSMP
jgi:hypothetical protein